jgi:hypothetical protein
MLKSNESKNQYIYGLNLLLSQVNNVKSQNLEPNEKNANVMK